MGIKIKALDDWLDDIKEKSPVLGEIVKQAIDQPLHIAMAVASAWAIGWPIEALGAPLWVAVTVSGVITATWMAVREYFQWPSSRWWDPVLDWTFQAGGLALGLWSIIAALG